jgi:hypothetical protein
MSGIGRRGCTWLWIEDSRSHAREGRQHGVAGAVPLDVGYSIISGSITLSTIFPPSTLT